MANPPAPKKNSAVTVALHVCTTCDRDPARMETPQAEGTGFLNALETHFAQSPLPGTKLILKPVKCLGGCECLPAGSSRPNGCCSVGLSAPGRWSYVLNRFNPESDIWKLAELLRLYLERPNGRIASKESPHRDAIKGHIGTRVPPFRDAGDGSA
jgi:predicted metal-binding protein